MCSHPPPVTGTATPRSRRRSGGVLRCDVNIFVGDANVRDLGGLGAIVPEGVEVCVIPPSAGG